MSTERLEQFSHQWRTLATKLGLAESESQRLCTYLLSQYGKSGRHYHNIQHILAMLVGFESLKDQFARPIAAELAIFFHDVVYDPSRNDNEAQSSLTMRSMLSGTVARDVLESAAFSIEATKGHAATASHDTNLILDLDMAILGQPWPAYEQYALGVMLEYLPTYGEAAYRQGRPKLFLEPTIALGQVFLTDAFQHLNEQAIENMRRERDILLSGGPFGP